MIPKYLATLAFVVLLVTLVVSSLPFATRSRVLAGATVDDTETNEFTIDADRLHMYEITPEVATYLKERIQVRAEGPARVVSEKVEITPKNVSWREDREKMSAPGAAMTLPFRWETASDSADGASGVVYLDLPIMPEFGRRTLTLHSGNYHKDAMGRYVIREVTAYRNGFAVAMARLLLALPAGLVWGIGLHCIVWALVLRGEKRVRLAALPPQGSGLPRTYYPKSDCRVELVADCARYCRWSGRDACGFFCL
jgi:hypothetical protein